MSVDYVVEPGERTGPTLEELYVQLEAAIGACATLVATAQAVLPNDVSRATFVALQQLCQFKSVVNPHPEEEDPF